MSADAAAAVALPAPAADKIVELKGQRKVLKRQLAEATKELKNQAGPIGAYVRICVFFIS